MLRLDHLAVVAASLSEGAAWLAARVGAAPAAGGSHPLMGTHNLLSATGPDSFLEVIAPDPEAPTPGRARWFGLDRPPAHPFLAAVLATDDLDAALAAGGETGIDLGRVVAVTRGDLRWRIAVRDDGAIPLDGAAPLLIEWPPGPHPATRMVDHGVRFESIALRSPDAVRLERLFDALGGVPAPLAVVQCAEPGVSAALVGADGRRVVLGETEAV